MQRKGAATLYERVAAPYSLHLYGLRWRQDRTSDPGGPYIPTNRCQASRWSRPHAPGMERMEGLLARPHRTADTVWLASRLPRTHPLRPSGTLEDQSELTAAGTAQVSDLIPFGSRWTAPSRAKKHARLHPRFPMTGPFYLRVLGQGTRRSISNPRACGPRGKIHISSTIPQKEMDPSPCCSDDGSATGCTYRGIFIAEPHGRQAVEPSGGRHGCKKMESGPTV